MSLTEHSFCGRCAQHADSCACRLCDVCSEAVAVDGAEPEHYDEQTDKVLCARCMAELAAMRDAHELKLYREQTRLEELGWRFDVSSMPMFNRWDVRAWHTYGVSESFMRETKSDALAQALQWASLMQGAADAA